MKAVIQRVLNASVSVEGEIISSIGRGLCVLVGISKEDTKNDIEYIVRKILNSRMFEDETGKLWSKSVKDSGGEILCLSQVTLYNAFKGNKLDFHQAMTREPGEMFYREFLEYLKSQYLPDLVKDGKFAAKMVVNIQNDGPVTLVIESPKETSKASNNSEPQETS